MTRIASRVHHDQAEIALIESRIVDLDAKITELEAARDALRRLAKQCGDATGGPCPILAAFEP